MKRKAAAPAQLHYATLPPRLIPKKLSYTSTQGFIRLCWGLIAESEKRCDLDLKGGAEILSTHRSVTCVVVLQPCMQGRGMLNNVFWPEHLSIGLQPGRPPCDNSPNQTLKQKLIVLVFP